MIFFLYGQDTFRTREKVKILKERFLKEMDKTGFNIAEIEADKANMSEIHKAILTQSFLVKKRMVIVKNIFKQNKIWQKELIDALKKGNFIQENNESNILIFIDDNPDKKTVLFKYLSQSKFKEEFLFLKPAEKLNWIISRIKTLGGTIERQAAVFLAGRLGEDLWNAANEIDKLVASKKGAEITVADTATMGTIKIDNNIFNITDAIANQDKKQALKLVEDNLSAGMNEIYLLGMIARQYRIIIQVKAEMEGAGNDNNLANSLGLPPFIARKAISQAGRYSKERLKIIYRKILETDLKLKSSNIAPRTLMEMLIVEI